MLRQAIPYAPFVVGLPMPATMNREVSEVSKKASEFSKMQTAEFVQDALHVRLAPPSMGSVKARLRHAQRELRARGWTANRVRDLWYADERASEPKWTEIHDLEELTGLEFARQELRTNDQLIANAEALLMGSDPDFVSAFVAALRTFAGALDRSRTGRSGEGE